MKAQSKMYKENYLPQVANKDIYTEFELYDPDFDMIVYHKIKKVERETKRSLDKKLKNEKQNIA